MALRMHIVGVDRKKLPDLAPCQSCEETKSKVLLINPIKKQFSIACGCGRKTDNYPSIDDAIYSWNWINNVRPAPTHEILTDERVTL